MVRELVQNPLMLNAKSVRATEEDVDVARDLIDTLQAHLDRFSGMAAVMSGKENGSSPSRRDRWSSPR